MKKLRGRNKSIKGQLIIKNIVMIFIVCNQNRSLEEKTSTFKKNS